MMKPEQVPKEVIVELLAALNSCDCDDCTSVAIAAAINAWPGFEYRADAAFPAFGYGPAAIILPLPQEAGDE